MRKARSLTIAQFEDWMRLEFANEDPRVVQFGETLFTVISGRLAIRRLSDDGWHSVDIRRDDLPVLAQLFEKANRASSTPDLAPPYTTDALKP